MAVVLPHRKLILVPKPSVEHYNLLDSIFVTKTISLPDGDVIALPHCDDSLIMLNNMGICTAGCGLFESYYNPPKNGKYRPWWWQMETASFLVANPKSYCTSTPRTGKTLSTIMAIDHLQKNEGRRAALVIAPLTVAKGGEWERTFREWLPDKRVVVIHEDRKNDLLKPADIYLINPDGLKIVAKELEQRVAQGYIDIGVVDELTEYANTKSQRWAAADAVLSGCKYRWGLTGTPGDPEKIYGQVKLINNEKVPRSFTQWRMQTMLKISPFKWVPLIDHEVIIEKAMAPTIRYNKDDLMDIPTPQVISEYVDLSPEQEAMTNTLVTELQVLADEGEITAATASALAQKLLQVSGGVVRGGDGLVKVDCQPKLDKLEEYLRKTPAKKVVFGSYTAINDMLVKEIGNMGFTVAKIDGSVTGGKRSDLINRFMDDDDIHVLVCHPRTMAFGVELARADHIICYGPPMAGAFIYQQMFERLSSSKQEADETFVVHLAAGKQDKVSFSNLANGVNIASNIVSIFTKEFTRQ